MPGLQGDLSVMQPADLFIWLGNREMSGRLVLERGTAKKDFLIERGQLIRASSSNPREFLGQLLVNYGIITEDQLEKAIQTQRETRVLLGRILVMIGLVDEVQLRQGLHINLREIALEAFRWRGGLFTFEVSAGQVPEIEVSVPMAELYHEAAQRDALWAQFLELFPHQGVIFHVEEALASALALQGPYARLVDLARDGTNIEGMALDLHATDFQLHYWLHELVKQGVLQPREPSTISSRALAEYATDQHAEAARRALAEHDFRGALSHAEAGMLAAPTDAALARLGREAQSKLAEEMGQEISKSAVPRLRVPIEQLLTTRTSARDRYILTRIDGARTIQSIMQVSPMRDVDALEIFKRYAAQGAVEFLGTAL